MLGDDRELWLHDYCVQVQQKPLEYLADRDEMDRLRAAMQADPDWVAYTQKSAELGALEAQENKLMRPVDFYPPPR